MKPTYDTNLARMAGNIAGGTMAGVISLNQGRLTRDELLAIAEEAVELARLIRGLCSSKDEDSGGGT